MFFLLLVGINYALLSQLKRPPLGTLKFCPLGNLTETVVLASLLIVFVMCVDGI